MDDRNATLRNRTKRYASRVVRLYVSLQKGHHFNDAQVILGKQLLRSATSVAANHREARHSRSAADRCAKFLIVLQELEESALWLELLIEIDSKERSPLPELLDETNQLIGIFVASLNTIRSAQR